MGSAKRPLKPPAVTPTPERVAFAKRLHAGWVWSGMSWRAVGKEMRTQRSPDGMSAESVARLGMVGAPIIKPPPWEMRRQLERVMGLPTGYLDGDTGLPPGKRTAKGPQGAADGPQSPQSVRALLDSQLAVYEAQGARLEPRMVRVMLDTMLEACVPTAQSGAATAAELSEGLQATLRPVGSARRKSETRRGAAAG